MAYHASSDQEPAYITIVEGPPPEFTLVNKPWTASLAEGPERTVIAMCEMRTFNGQALVDRCRRAWQEGRPARLDYPRPSSPVAPSSERAQADIVAARWERVPEGQKLILWVKVDNIEELNAKREGE
jgi:hypothetical protein